MRFQLPCGGLRRCLQPRVRLRQRRRRRREAARQLLCMWPRQVASVHIVQRLLAPPHPGFRSVSGRDAKGRLPVHWASPGRLRLIAWPVFCAWKLRLVARTTAAQPPSSGDAEAALSRRSPCLTSCARARPAPGQRGRSLLHSAAAARWAARASSKACLTRQQRR
uniref:ANK_REP_REGION domain-containing protein n=1 Tax=Macrostomum lignano TaxID=282301 RepID=A0A1I8FJC7_9PLAT